MSWPPPLEHPCVVAEVDGNGWLYDSDGRLPWGDYHWTAHLTNALHDAGWQVRRERVDLLRRRINREATRR